MMLKIKSAIKAIALFLGYYKYKVVIVRNKEGHPWDLFAVKFPIKENEKRITYGLSFIKRTKLGEPSVVYYTNSKKNLFHRVNLLKTDEDVIERVRKVIG